MVAVDGMNAWNMGGGVGPVSICNYHAIELTCGGEGPHAHQVTGDHFLCSLIAGGSYKDRE